MRAVNIHEAKTHLSRLVERVGRGEEITLAKAGRPVAKIVPLAPRVGRRSPGTAKGRIVVAPDFDAPLPRELRTSFE
ncbi:MAG TPA: type II toxin-antitoxin system Phd/YefM family antitoxin [Candidatus Limnocylindria bacterium]|nr:type II toxin-antitoxin system Phd/YefM family antitoxin [Candidatus Limnocylindria bacterium]